MRQGKSRIFSSRSYAIVLRWSGVLYLSICSVRFGRNKPLPHDRKCCGSFEVQAYGRISKIFSQSSFVAGGRISKRQTAAIECDWREYMLKARAWSCNPGTRARCSPRQGKPTSVTNDCPSSTAPTATEGCGYMRHETPCIRIRRAGRVASCLPQQDLRQDLSEFLIQFLNSQAVRPDVVPAIYLRGGHEHVSAVSETGFNLMEGISAS